ncbi:MAG: type IV secretory system conjugative DNA transfer family protein [Acidimicrobiales bacterium]
MLFLGRSNHEPVYARPESHLLVVGPPRSGKTTSFVIPNLLEHSGPAVVTSTKTDLIEATYAMRRARGRLWLFDPSGTITCPAGVTPARWSLVSEATSYDTATVIASEAVDTALGIQHGASAHWSDRAKALLGPLLFAAHRSEGEIEDVVRWIDTRNAESAMSILVGVGAYRAEEVLSGILQSESKELSAIYSTASAALGAYRTEAALAVGAVTNFDVSSFVASSDTLYVVAPATVQRQCAPIVVGLLEAVREHSYRQNTTRGSQHPRVRFLLDEMANIAPLSNLGSVLSEGASQGIELLGCLQDLTQARLRWPELSKGFLTLFGTTVLLPGIGDLETLRTVAALVGDRHVMQRSFTVESRRTLGSHHRRSPSYSFSTRREPRVSLDQLAQITSGTALVFEPSRGLGRIELAPYFERERSNARPSLSRESPQSGR